VSVTVDKKAWDKTLALMEFLDKKDPHATVGWYDGKSGDHGEGLSNVQLAAVHEFGLPEKGIPARRPLATTMERIQPQVASKMEAMTERLIAGAVRGDNSAQSVRQEMGRLGLWAEAETKKTIATGPHLEPALQEATVLRKGSDRPLVDTGALVASITSEYREGSDD
jgi:hypothetical protein